MKTYCALALGTLLLAVSCASGPYVQKEKNVLALVELINDGKVQDVPGLAVTPFALDGEILYLNSDVETYWKNLKDAGFTMTDTRLVISTHVTEDSWNNFATTYDMKNFFAKYTGKDTSLVELRTSEGRYYLLLERKVKGYPSVRGMRGPIK